MKKKTLFKSILFIIVLSFLLMPTNKKISINKKDYKNQNSGIQVVETTDIVNGKFDVIVRDVPNNVNTVAVQVWSEKNKQDDIHCYFAEKQGDGNYKATVELKNHKFEKGLYNIHVYKKNNNTIISTNTAVKQIEELKTGELTATPDGTDSNVTIKLTSDSDYLQGTVRFAVWSDNNWQDDMKWYDAKITTDGATVTIPMTNHKDFGKFYVHAYTWDSKGNPIFIKDTNFNIEIPELQGVTSSFNQDTNILKINIASIDSKQKITRVQLPTWSEEDWQDDLKWYDATKQPDGSWTYDINVGNHYFSDGNYKTHVYLTTQTGAVISVREINTLVHPTETLIASVDSTNTNFTINFGKYKKYKNKIIRFAVWSDNKGQDDMKWYEAKNGSYTGSFADHGTADEGSYTVHVYTWDKKGNPVYLDQTSFTPTEKPIINNIEITPMENGKFDVIIKNVYSSTTQIRVPVWSNKKGQDDIKWYNATKQADGSYKATVSIKNHNYDEGVYNVHIYITSSKNPVLGIPTKTSISITNKGTFLEPENLNNNDMNLKLTLTNSVYLDSKIKFAVWSDNNGQNDMKWYDAKIENGNATSIVPISNHKDSGSYTVHAYTWDTKGNPIYIEKTSFNIDSNLEATSEIIHLDTEDKDTNGIYQVKIHDIVTNSGAKEAKVKVWTNNNDSYTYTATKQSDGSLLTPYILPKNHKYNNGIYHTEVTVYANNGISKTFKVDDTPPIKLQVVGTPVNLGKGQIRLYIKNVPSTTNEISIASWVNGQSPAIWRSAKRLPDYSWYVDIKSAKHKPWGKTITDVYKMKGGVPEEWQATIDTVNTYAYVNTPRYYEQKDPRWANNRYGSLTLGQSGCMPTSLAMTITEVLSNSSNPNREVWPDEVANYLYYNTNTYNKFFQGTSYDSAEMACKYFGVDHEYLSTVEDIKKALDGGAMVIGAVGHGRYVWGWNATHAVVMWGGGSDGNTIVYDSNNPLNNGIQRIQDIYNERSQVPEDNYTDIYGTKYAFHAIY